MVFNSNLKLNNIFTRKSFLLHKNIQTFNKITQVDSPIILNPVLKTYHHKADLINWPDGLKPKKGNVSKSALFKLKVSNLKEELTRRNITAKGNKEVLINTLMEALNKEWHSLKRSRLLSKKSNKEDLNEEHVAKFSEKDFVEVKDSNNGIYSASIFLDGDLPSNAHELTRTEIIEYLQINKTRMQLIFLGTASEIPTEFRSLGCTVFRTQSDIWLFDIGEDTQRQALKHPILRPGKIARIFITTLTNELISGLAGMLCTIAASKERGHSLADIPLHVYGPPGLANYVTSVMELSQTYLEMPVIIHELGKLPKNSDPVVLTHRARLWSVYIPPDVYNPLGYYDAKLDTIRPLQRIYTLKTGRRASHLNSTDSRACYRKMPLPNPGNPSKYRDNNLDLCWTLSVSEEFKIIAIPLDNEKPSVTYIIQEADRAGHLDATKAKNLGVIPGKNFKYLKNGTPVLNQNGELITSSMVVSDDTPGRTIVIMGETKNKPLSIIKKITKKIDILVTPIAIRGDKTKENAINFNNYIRSCLEDSKELNAKFTIISRIPKNDLVKNVKKCKIGDVNLEALVGFDFYTYVIPKVQKT